MIFHCRKCNNRMDETAITSHLFKDYKAGKLPLLAVACPFCGYAMLEVEE